MFLSNPQQVLVIRLAASAPGMLRFTATLNGGDNPYQVTIDSHGDVLLHGRAVETSHSDGQTGVTFHARLRIIAKQRGLGQCPDAYGARR